MKTPTVPNDIARRKSTTQLQNMNALNVTLSSPFLTNVLDMKKLCLEYRDELSRFNIFNRTGMKLMLRSEHKLGEYLVENEADAPKVIDILTKVDNRNNEANANVCADTQWTVELGMSRNRFLEQQSMSVYELDQLNVSRKRSSFMRMHSDMDASGMNSLEELPPIEDFTGLYKPLQDVSFKSLGEKCFMLLDKKTDNSTGMELNRRDKQMITEDGLFVLLEVLESKKAGVKKIVFGSQIQVRSELPFGVKLLLEVEGLDNTFVDIASDQTRHIPVRYCTQDTTMNVLGHVERVATLEEGGLDSEIKFSNFFIDTGQYTNTSSYYLKEANSGWDRLVEKDISLTVSVITKMQDKFKAGISATIYRKKIVVSNRGTQKVFAFTFLICLRPIMVVVNCTPRTIKLRLNDNPWTAGLDPGEKYVYKDQRQISTDTVIKVGLVGPEFKESSSCYPYEYKNKRLRVATVKLVHKEDSKNRLCLKVEIRRYSSSHIKCFVYCPFLIYNETEFNLFYRSHVFHTKVDKVGVAGWFDLNDQWIMLAEENKEEFKDEDLLDISDGNLSESAPQETAVNDFLVRIAKNLEMYCPEKRPQSICISTNEENWSNPFILRFKDSSCFQIKQTKADIAKVATKDDNKDKRQSSLRHKLRFLVYVDQLSGVFSRSKLIMIQPYYIIKNIDESMSLAVTQFDLLDYKISIKPKSAIIFNWPHRDSEEYMILAQVEAASNALQTDWSRKFRIDLPGRFTVKCSKAGSFNYVTVNVYHEVNSPYYITLSKATKESLPLKLINETKYEMNFSQILLDSKRQALTPSGAEVVNVKPFGVAYFAWDENVPPRKLRVQIEDIEKVYEMETIRDLPPIVLNRQQSSKEPAEIKHHLRGYLKRRNIYDDREAAREEYCLLNFTKQVLKIYPSESAYPTTIKLRNAQIDEDYQRNEFLLVYDKQSYYFQCQGIVECKLWVNSLIKAKNLFQEDTIFIKTEPTEYNRVLTFYRTQNFDKVGDNNSDSATRSNPNQFEQLSVMCLHMPKIIGISVVDHNAKELIHIIVEDFFLKKTNIVSPVSKATMYLTTNIVQNEERRSDRDLMLLREYIQLSIENVEIENQIDVAPFPILLAPRSRFSKSAPFLNMEVHMKNVIAKNQQNKIKYLSTVNVFIGPLDLKVDDQTIQMCMEMYKQLNLSKSKAEIEELRLHAVQKFQPVYMKLEDKERSSKNTSRMYIKRLNIEPIRVRLTFRAASKSDQTIATNLFSDFGLIFASIKDAGIELEGFKSSHVFGTPDLLMKMVVYTYKEGVMKQLYKLFGSFEIFGNPSSFFNEIRNGFKNLLVVPFKELKEKRNLKIFGKRMVLGTKSFAVSILFGLFSAAVSIIESVARYIDYFTFDQKFRYKRQKLLDIGINGFLDGVVLGLKSFRLCRLY